MRGMMSEQMTFKDQIKRELRKIEDTIILDKAYGGIECKIEEGRLVHFKYWVNKKIK